MSLISSCQQPKINLNTLQSEKTNHWWINGDVVSKALKIVSFCQCFVNQKWMHIKSLNKKQNTTRTIQFQVYSVSPFAETDQNNINGNDSPSSRILARNKLQYKQKIHKKKGKHKKHIYAYKYDTEASVCSQILRLSSEWIILRISLLFWLWHSLFIEVNVLPTKT